MITPKKESQTSTHQLHVEGEGEEVEVEEEETTKKISKEHGFVSSMGKDRITTLGDVQSRSRPSRKWNVTTTSTHAL